MSDATSISRHFSKGSVRYDREAVAQRQFANVLAQQLPLLKSGARILEIGCGSGFLTELLNAKYSHCTIQGIDISSTMLAAAEAALGQDASAVTLLHGDARNFVFDAKFDLITSCSAMHWIRPFDSLLEKLAALLTKDGRLHFSLMLHGTLGELHQLRRELFPNKLPRAELPTFAEVQSTLEHVGFTIAHAERSQVTESYQSATAFIDHIRETGLTGGAVSTAYKPLTRKELQLLTDTYQSTQQLPTGQVQATYCSATFQALPPA